MTPWARAPIHGRASTRHPMDPSLCDIPHPTPCHTLAHDSDGGPTWLCALIVVSFR
jgi:hypothetical protein